MVLYCTFLKENSATLLNKKNSYQIVFLEKAQNFLSHLSLSVLKTIRRRKQQYIFFRAAFFHRHFFLFVETIIHFFETVSCWNYAHLSISLLIDDVYQKISFVINQKKNSVSIIRCGWYFSCYGIITVFSKCQFTKYTT